MRRVRTAESGFTLVEVMIVVAIIGLLASLAAGSYGRYVTKARVTEAYALISALKTEVLAGYAAGGGNFPLKIADSTARVPRDNGGTRRAPGNLRVVRTDHLDVVTRYMYEVRPGARRAWFDVRLDRRQIDGCGNQCRIHFGFQTTRSGELKTFCGTWTAGNNFRFPRDILPAACSSTCVRCDMNRARNE